MRNYDNRAGVWQQRSVVAAIFLFLACHADAAVRVTEGVFEECSYGNQGGICTYLDESGKEQEIDMPNAEDSNVHWFIDGKEVPDELVDGGFFVPAHPAFQEDRVRGHLPFLLRGCPIRVVEQPGRTEIYIDSKACKPLVK